MIDTKARQKRVFPDSTTHSPTLRSPVTYAAPCAVARARTAMDRVRPRTSGKTYARVPCMTTAELETTKAGFCGTWNWTESYSPKSTEAAFGRSMTTETSPDWRALRPIPWMRPVPRQPSPWRRTGAFSLSRNARCGGSRASTQVSPRPLRAATVVPTVITVPEAPDSGGSRQREQRAIARPIVAVALSRYLQPLDTQYARRPPRPSHDHPSRKRCPSRCNTRWL
jgi:hypothetical protein